MYVVSLQEIWNCTTWFKPCSLSQSWFHLDENCRQDTIRGIRVRIPKKLDVVAFWSWNLNVMVFQSWNIDVVTFCPLKKCLGITMLSFICLLLRHGVLVVKFGCCGLGFYSPFRGFLVLESRCCGICASTTSFSFLLNLLCHISNVDMWFVN